MEDKVWTNHEVDSLMRTRYVVVSLYVDEKRKLAVSDRITYTTSTGDEQTLTTVGDKWTAYQKENFLAVSQPQYAILDADQKAMTKTKYKTSAKDFAEWLRCGLDAYEKSRNNTQ